ncbi:MAG: hypothetical protein OXR62_05390 [Ahrensia sp.]|nr:hypothetical protein [Ahrensia sp.]
MGLRFLLVDDNDNQHELFRCYASRFEMIEFCHAMDMEQAKAEIGSNSPDVVLLDNRLHPYDDFRDTVPQIRGAGFKGKIVLISSDIDHPIFGSARDFSVHACVNKYEFTLQNFGDKLMEIVH